MSRAIKQHNCTIWWTWNDGGEWFGAAYCARYGWHVVNLGFKLKRSTP